MPPVPAVVPPPPPAPIAVRFTHPDGHAQHFDSVSFAVSDPPLLSALPAGVGVSVVAGEAQVDWAAVHAAGLSALFADSGTHAMQGHRFSISPQRAGLALDRLRALNFDFSVRRPSLGVLSADIENFAASHCSDADLD